MKKRFTAILFVLFIISLSTICVFATDFSTNIVVVVEEPSTFATENINNGGMGNNSTNNTSTTNETENSSANTNTTENNAVQNETIQGALPQIGASASVEVSNNTILKDGKSALDNSIISTGSIDVSATVLISALITLLCCVVFRYTKKEKE